MWFELFFWLCVMCIGHLIALPFVRWWFVKKRLRTDDRRGEPGGDLWSADAVCGFAFACVVSITALDVTQSLRHTPESRWFGIGNNFTGMIIASRFIVHLGVLAVKGINRSRLILLFHHILVISLCMFSMVRGLSHFWMGAAAVCQITNIHTMILEMSMSCADFQSRKQESWFRINSACLAVTYIAFRVIFFPALLGLWLHDVIYYPEITWYDDRNGFVEKYFYPFAYMAIWGMSFYGARDHILRTYALFTKKEIGANLVEHGLLASSICGSIAAWTCCSI